MLKNKFNIGQKVIVVSEGVVVEKVVEGIRVKEGELMYELNVEHPSSFPIWQPNTFHRSVIGHLADRFEVPAPKVKYVNRFAEDEIFESEEDFRANVIIQKIEPTKKELKQQLKEYNVADETLKNLINKAI